MDEIEELITIELSEYRELCKFKEDVLKKKIEFDGGVIYINKIVPASKEKSIVKIQETVLERQLRYKNLSNEELSREAAKEFVPINEMIEKTDIQRGSVIDRGRTAQNNFRLIMREVRDRNPPRAQRQKARDDKKRNG